MTLDEQVRAEDMGTRLGYLGLIPFVAGAVTALLSEELLSLAFQAFILYSLAILSFMGGVHWGLALIIGTRQSTRLLISVVPVIVAWICLIALPAPLTLAVLGGCFIAQWFIDRPILAELPIPSWYLEMRPRLAYAVAGCHLFILFRTMS
ncbi:MAG: DUF3429 domain-containing protein [Gammaproteobacteria bacterium]|nr:DUF3429 domain-containing protein [Gammaproteobacteria bacterium]HAN80729.1 DUF3429 domain-containing protein [Gammaproteobacteria bacterium]|tara:strand:+ start:639 stop:1088 length:450 start_codon:yes stop_codon:yes gene_type:complete